MTQCLDKAARSRRDVLVVDWAVGRPFAHGTVLEDGDREVCAARTALKVPYGRSRGVPLVGLVSVKTW